MANGAMAPGAGFAGLAADQAGTSPTPPDSGLPSPTKRRRMGDEHLSPFGSPLAPWDGTFTLDLAALLSPGK